MDLWKVESEIIQNIKRFRFVEVWKEKLEVPLNSKQLLCGIVEGKI